MYYHKKTQGNENAPTHYYVIGKYFVEEPVVFNTVVCVTLDRVLCFEFTGNVTNRGYTYIRFRKAGIDLPTEMLISLGYRKDGKWGATRSPFCYVYPDKRKNSPSDGAYQFISKINVLNQGIFDLRPHHGASSANHEQVGEKKRTTKLSAEDSEEEEAPSPRKLVKKQKLNASPPLHESQPASSSCEDLDDLELDMFTNMLDTQGIDEMLEAENDEDNNPALPDPPQHINPTPPLQFINQTAPPNIVPDEHVQWIVNQIAALSLQSVDPPQYYLEFIQRVATHHLQNNQ